MCLISYHFHRQLPNTSAIESQTMLRQNEWSLGLVMLLGVVILWVLSSFLVDGIFKDDLYSKPFLITYLNTSVFVLYLIPYHFYKQVLPSDALTHRETSVLAAKFCLLWFLSNLVNNASLLYTSVSNQTILSSTSSFFTLLVCWIVGIDTISRIKLTGLVLSFVGVLLINYKTDAISAHPLWGNVLALLGAVCYGVYSAMLKLKAINFGNINMRLFFGYVGIYNTLFVWPLLVVLHLTGLETLEMPHGSTTWKLLAVNCFISFIADFLWANATLLTSPLTVTVGLSLTIPIAMVGDWVFRQRATSVLYVLSAMLILVSFIIINREEEKVEVDEQREEDA
ncbi:unnamed protein product [Kuraishia capsulata CBS 1993]|uniref:EamA domain-containing protein n=1 Tax=Kuraishia capsulata CBS 1993 TaxID=1382522 RepID=W6MLC0_9ASCO|nr:uncharacterized protein KUCA_T00003272001 [Kuraishia capsulata CBS 1993]CDK27294.1 unnamed protein product [Kuraishia capsulata CBS 1993]